MNTTTEELLAKYSQNVKKGLEVGRFDNSMLTAKEAKQALIEGIEFHVKAALKAAAENAIAKENPMDYGTGEIWVDKKSILNAYPLTNIK